MNVETDVPSLPIREREKQAKAKPVKAVSRKQLLQEAKDKAIIEGWRNDPRMVFLCGTAASGLVHRVRSCAADFTTITNKR